MHIIYQKGHGTDLKHIHTNMSASSFNNPKEYLESVFGNLKALSIQGGRGLVHFHIKLIKPSGKVGERVIGYIVMTK